MLWKRQFGRIQAYLMDTSIEIEASNFNDILLVAPSLYLLFLISTSCLLLLRRIHLDHFSLYLRFEILLVHALCYLLQLLYEFILELLGTCVVVHNLLLEHLELIIEFLNSFLC